jgi:hypothetical protein
MSTRHTANTDNAFHANAGPSVDAAARPLTEPDETIQRESWTEVNQAVRQHFITWGGIH